MNEDVERFFEERRADGLCRDNAENFDHLMEIVEKVYREADEPAAFQESWDDIREIVARERNPESNASARSWPDFKGSFSTFSCSYFLASLCAGKQLTPKLCSPPCCRASGVVGAIFGLLTGSLVSSVRAQVTTRTLPGCPVGGLAPQPAIFSGSVTGGVAVNTTFLDFAKEAKCWAAASALQASEREVINDRGAHPNISPPAYYRTVAHCVER
jgi:hypothetical protein